MMSKLYNHIHKKQSGFTLVEIMVVIAVMSVLSGVAIPSYVTIKNRARESGTESIMRNTATALEMYRIDNDRYPSSDEGTKLLEKGSFINHVPEEDLWENQYSYSSDGNNYTYQSSGVDGKSGTEDDIVFQNGTMTADGGYSDSGDGTGSGPAVLFLSNFGNMDNFFPIMGKWSIEDNLLKPSTKTGQNRIVFGDSDWSDYEVSVNANLLKGKGYGIYYRSNNEKRITGYVFQYDPGLRDKFVVRKVTNGREASAFQTVKMPAGFQVHNKSHNISISVEGDHHVIKVDDEIVFDFKDDWRDSGMAGFRSWGRSDVDFIDVNVTEK